MALLLQYLAACPKTHTSSSQELNCKTCILAASEVFTTNNNTFKYCLIIITAYKGFRNPFYLDYSGNRVSKSPRFSHVVRTISVGLSSAVPVARYVLAERDANEDIWGIPVF